MNLKNHCPALGLAVSQYGGFVGNHINMALWFSSETFHTLFIKLERAGLGGYLDIWADKMVTETCLSLAIAIWVTADS